MKKLFVLVVILFTSVCFAQEEESKGLRPDFLLAPFKLALDGELTVLSSSAFVGVATDLSLGDFNLTPGVYMSFGLDTAEETTWKLGLAANVKFFGSFGIGAYYDLWHEGRGIVGPNTEIIGILISLDFEL